MRNPDDILLCDFADPQAKVARQRLGTLIQGVIQEKAHAAMAHISQWSIVPKEVPGQCDRDLLGHFGTITVRYDGFDRNLNSYEFTALPTPVTDCDCPDMPVTLEVGECAGPCEHRLIIIDDPCGADEAPLTEEHEMAVQQWWNELVKSRTPAPAQPSIVQPILCKACQAGSHDHCGRQVSAANITCDCAVCWSVPTVKDWQHLVEGPCHPESQYTIGQLPGLPDREIRRLVRAGGGLLDLACDIHMGNVGSMECSEASHRWQRELLRLYLARWEPSACARSAVFDQHCYLLAKAALEERTWFDA